MNYIWKIENLVVARQLAEQRDVVTSASWRVIAIDGELRGMSHGTVNFPAPDGEKFTAYEDLTEATILSWVWEFGISTDPDTPWSRLIAEQQANALIELQRAGVTERPLPWVTPPPPQPERATLEQRTEALELLVEYLLEGPTA
jgi:hypothetical protein